MHDFVVDTVIHAALLTGVNAITVGSCLRRMVQTAELDRGPTPVNTLLTHLLHR